MDGYLAQVMVFAGNYAPKNWAPCEGQEIAISQLPALFAVMGITYGGNGVTTFGFPDLRGRSPVGWGQGSELSFIPLGGHGGIESFTLTTSQLPTHNHTATFAGAAASGAVSPSAFGGRGTLTNDPTGRFPAKTATGTNIYADSSDTQMGQSPVDVTVSNVLMQIGSTGGSMPVGCRSPYLGMFWIICTDGLFPSRN